MGVKVKKSLKKFARKRLSDVITQRRRLRPVIQEMKEKAKRKEVRRVESARAEELAHQAQLQQLVEADQEFMNYLKTEDPSLLSFGADVLDSEDNPEEDEKEEAQEGEHDPLGLTPGAQQQPWEVLKSRLEAIFCAVVGNDPKGRNDNPTGSISRNGLRTATVTFQEAVARVSRGGAEEGPNPSHQQGLIEEDEEEEESRDKRGSHAPKYSTNKVQLSVRDSDAQRTIDLYVIETCTRNLPMAFNLYLKRSPRGALPKKCSQYHTIASLIRSYVTNLAHLITHLTQDVLKMRADATAIPGGAVTLLEYLFHHTAMLGTEYMGAFPIPMKRIVKSTLHCLMVAANNNNNNNVCESESDVEKGKAIDPPKDSELLEDEEPSPLYSASGALLRACARALGPGVRELLFKGIFQRYVQSDMVRKWSPKTAPAAYNMELFLVDLYGYDLPLAYQTLFGYVKQLAICLRTALLQPEDETALRTLHSWKYLCAFRCCERIVAAYATPEGLAPLVYPVCQIGLGVLDVFASPRAYPLHFHILNILVHLGESASVTVPLTPYFLRILSAPSFTSGTKKSGPNDAPKGVSSSSSAPGGEYRIPFLLRTNKASLKSTVYLTAVLKELMYVMTRHTAAHAHRIGFPEHFTLLHASIRRIRKACPRVEWASLLQEYLRRVDATEEFLRTRRCGVTFGPCDEVAIEAWEATVAREWCGGHAGSALLTGGNAAAVRCPLISYCLQLHRRREEALHRLMVYATLSSVTQQDGSDDDDDDDATNYGTEDAPSPEAAAMTTRRESSPQAATGEQPRRRAKRRVTLEDIVEHEDALARGKQRRASQENKGEIRAKQQVGGEGGSAHDPVERKRRARE